jgi:predicted Kef-type K+ transport protein
MSSTPARQFLVDLTPDLTAMVIGTIFRDHLDQARATTEALALADALETWLCTFVEPHD